MRTINLETWPRRDHFAFYNAFAHPEFGITANVDISTFYPAVKQLAVSFTIAMVYLISRAANAIPEFRQRIRGSEVIEHEIVHPSFTILVTEEIFSFCTVEYVDEFPIFAANAAQAIGKVKKQVQLEDEPGRDDWLFMTSIPWISFTSIRHPMQSHPADSVPRIAWGKFFQSGNTLWLPLSVDAHHALVDGLHVGKFYLEMERFLKDPNAVLATGDHQV